MNKSAISAAMLIGGSIAILAIGVAPANADSSPTSTAKAAAVNQHASALAAYPLRCEVTASNVNYRRGPGTQYASFGQVSYGFQFASDGGVSNPRSRLQYWDIMSRSGRSDGYIDDAYVYCWLA